MPLEEKYAVSSAKVASYSWFVAVILMMTYAVQHIDRQIMAVILEPVKTEFSLSDSQLGLLSGLAFAVAFCVAAIPVGILVDRGNRRNILVVALTIWSGMTALGALATSYFQLVAARLLVGAGESGGTPSAISLLSDYFPREKRSSATGIFFFGQGIGILSGFALGGFIVAEYGWRAALLVAGVPGLILAAIIFLSVREPAKQAPPRLADDGANAATYADTLRVVWRQRSLFWIVVATLFGSAMMAAVLTWIVSFLVRTHGVDVRSAGLAVGIGMGLSGAFGAASGGFVADWFGRQRTRNVPLLIALTQGFSVVSFAIAVLSGQYILAVAFGSLGLMFSHMRDGPAYAYCATLAGAGRRGKIMALVLILNNFVGYGLGPLLAGALSDFFAATMGEDSLRFALLGIVAIGAVGILPFVFAARTIEPDVAWAENNS